MAVVSQVPQAPKAERSKPEIMSAQGQEDINGLIQQMLEVLDHLTPEGAYQLRSKFEDYLAYRTRQLFRDRESQALVFNGLDQVVAQCYSGKMPEFIEKFLKEQEKLNLKHPLPTRPDTASGNTGTTSN